MSEDRYEWLDKETVERLLRGLSADDRAADVRGAEPDRLVTALGGLSAEPTAGLWEHSHLSSRAEELPGEAAAVEAFRLARRGVSQVDTVSTAGATGTGGRGLLRALPSLAGRPLRAGVAMAVAGCALGGVAVAATSGVLPAPFGTGTGGGGPAKPAVSVSPKASPGGTSDDDRRAAGGPHSKDKEKDKKRDDRSSSADPERGGSKGEDQDRGGGADERDGKRGGSDQPSHDADSEAIIVALCKAYTGGKLAADDRRTLERAAGGPGAVRAYCASALGQTPGGGSGGSGSSGGEDGDEGGDSGGDPPGGSGGGPGGGYPGDPGGPGGDKPGGSNGGSEGGDDGGSAGGDDGGTAAPGGAQGGGSAQGGSEGGSAQGSPKGGGGEPGELDNSGDGDSSGSGDGVDGTDTPTGTSP